MVVPYAGKLFGSYIVQQRSKYNGGSNYMKNKFEIRPIIDIFLRLFRPKMKVAMKSYVCRFNMFECVRCVFSLKGDTHLFPYLAAYSHLIQRM